MSPLILPSASSTCDSATNARSTLPVEANCQVCVMFSPTTILLPWLSLSHSPSRVRTCCAAVP